MDVLWFLENRLDFIQSHYHVGTAPFLETIRKIEAGEEPYSPIYAEDSEPQFLEEWEMNKLSVEMIGASCISMLHVALDLYFSTWKKELQDRYISRFDEKAKKAIQTAFNKGGILSGYKTMFSQIIGDDWNSCRASFSVLEQITLARNDTQHRNEIHDLRHKIGKDTLSKYSLPIFADAIGIRMAHSFREEGNSPF